MSAHLIDGLNRKTMRQSVGEYIEHGHNLRPAEEAALRCVPDVRGKAILDLGIGAGRTVLPLLEISSNYIGIDYVEEMVEHCKKTFPGTRFEQGDARDLSRFEDGSFQLIMFSLNGISMVNHEGRLEILKEAFRLLAPGGTFLFSTYNQDNQDYKKRFQLPRFQPCKNPVRLAVRGMKYAHKVSVMAANRYRFRKHEFHCEEYAMINDKCHNYATMLYYITLENQKKQLIFAGFDQDIRAFDRAGCLINEGTQDDSLFFIAQKPHL